MIKERTIAAMESPLSLAKDSLEFYDNIEFAVEFGNKNLTSDAIVASILLHSAIESAIVNVQRNAKLAKLGKQKIVIIVKNVLLITLIW